MLLHNVIQGTPEWFACRLGIPTASEFDKIITPTGKPSTQADGYANKLIAEFLTGKPVDAFEGSSWTERGNELEPNAAQFYELQMDCEVAPVGFITNDAKTMGCSPDRLVGDDGLLEIKCPAPHTHVQYMLNGKIDQKYYPQIQGQLLVTDRQWVDLISYHPEMPPVIIRVERNEKFLTDLRGLLDGFMQDLAGKRKELIERGYMEPPAEVIEIPAFLLNRKKYPPEQYLTA